MPSRADPAALSRATCKAPELSSPGTGASRYTALGSSGRVVYTDAPNATDQQQPTRRYRKVFFIAKQAKCVQPGYECGYCAERGDFAFVSNASNSDFGIFSFSG